MNRAWVILIFCFSASSFGSKIAPRLQEIKVSLFGQPCVMSGPFQDTVLKSIHSISPEQMPPVQNKEQAKVLLNRMKSVGAIPSELFSYKEKQIKKIEGITAFFDALIQAKKDSTPDAVLGLSSKWIYPESKKEFDTGIRSSLTRENLKRWNDATGDQARDVFERSSEADPQEEFHRSIQKIRVSYNCTYEETDQAEQSE